MDNQNEHFQGLLNPLVSRIEALEAENKALKESMAQLTKTHHTNPTSKATTHSNNDNTLKIPGTNNTQKSSNIKTVNSHTNLKPTEKHDLLKDKPRSSNKDARDEKHTTVKPLTGLKDKNDHKDLGKTPATTANKKTISTSEKEKHLSKSKDKTHAAIHDHKDIKTPEVKKESPVIKPPEVKQETEVKPPPHEVPLENHQNVIIKHEDERRFQDSVKNQEVKITPDNPERNLNTAHEETLQEKTQKNLNELRMEEQNRADKI